MQNLENRKCQK